VLEFAGDEAQFDALQVAFAPLPEAGDEVLCGVADNDDWYAKIDDPS